MLKLKYLVNTKATGKKTLVFFILANIIYVAMLSITIPHITSFSGDLKILDMLPMGYDAPYVKSLFEALGEDGRNYYLYRQIPLDMIYPALFAISFCLIMAYFLKKLDRHDSLLFYLCLLPVIAGLADYAENIGIITLLTNYPDLSTRLIGTTSIFSIIKSSSTTLFFISLLIILIILGIKKLGSKNGSNPQLDRS